MANKKFGKLLAFAAITGAAIAAGIAYFNRKKDSEIWEDDLDDFDEDFDDEDFDFPMPTEKEESAVKREYVSLNIDKETASNSEAETSIIDEATLEASSTLDVQDETTDSDTTAAESADEDNML